MVDAYSAAFIDRMAPVADAQPTLERLAGRGFALGILSNWPLAVTIDRFAEAQGWLPYLRAIVVSAAGRHDQAASRRSSAPPRPRSACRSARDGAPGRSSTSATTGPRTSSGASRAGWRTAYLRDRQHDTPLPTSEPGDGDAGRRREPVTADLEIDELAELDALVDLAAAGAT